MLVLESVLLQAALHKSTEDLMKAAEEIVHAERKNAQEAEERAKQKKKLLEQALASQAADAEAAAATAQQKLEDAQKTAETSVEAAKSESVIVTQAEVVLRDIKLIAPSAVDWLYVHGTQCRE